MTAVAVASALALAFVLGCGDAANASAALIASHTTSYRRAMGWSFGWHTFGGLVGGSAVALTIANLVQVPADETAAVLTGGSLSAVVFTRAAVRRGMPVSASYGLVGGLVGAALAQGGTGSVYWGGMDGWKPVGVFGAVVGLLLSPVIGLCAAAVVRIGARVSLRRARQEALRPLRRALWGASALVGIADGINDGQKAMGVAAAALLAGGRIDTLEVPWWVRVSVAVILAVGTAVGGPKVVRTVAQGLYRGDVVDELAVQISAAGTIVASAAVGAPVSTSSVVAVGTVGVGLVQRRRHVRWVVAREVVLAWLLTVPACIVLGAVFELMLEVVS